MFLEERSDGVKSGLIEDPCSPAAVVHRRSISPLNYLVSILLPIS